MFYADLRYRREGCFEFHQGALPPESALSPGAVGHVVVSSGTIETKTTVLVQATPSACIVSLQFP